VQAEVELLAKALGKRKSRGVFWGNVVKRRIGRNDAGAIAAARGKGAELTGRKEWLRGGEYERSGAKVRQDENEKRSRRRGAETPVLLQLSPS
jgi:hypothetical protein